MADEFAVDKQLGDSGRPFALERLRFAGGLELEAQDAVPAWDLDVGDDLEVLLGDVVSGEPVGQPHRQAGPSRFSLETLDVGMDALFPVSKDYADRRPFA